MWLQSLYFYAATPPPRLPVPCHWSLNNMRNECRWSGWIIYNSTLYIIQNHHGWISLICSKISFISDHCLSFRLRKFSLSSSPPLLFQIRDTGKFSGSIFVWASSESLEDILRSCSAHESFFPRPLSSVRSRMPLNLWGIKIDFPSPYVWSELWPLGLSGFVPGQQQKGEYDEEKSFGPVFKNPVKSVKVYVFSDAVTHRGRRKRRWGEGEEEGEREERTEKANHIRKCWYFKNNVFFPPVNLKQGIQIRTYKSQPRGTFP